MKPFPNIYYDIANSEVPELQLLLEANDASAFRSKWYRFVKFLSSAKHELTNAAKAKKLILLAYENYPTLVIIQDMRIVTDEVSSQLQGELTPYSTGENHVSSH